MLIDSTFLLLRYISPRFFSFFFFNDTATTEIYTLSLHDALPICGTRPPAGRGSAPAPRPSGCGPSWRHRGTRSEEHTSELQSRLHLVCRLLLEKKKKKHTSTLERRRCQTSMRYEHHRLTYSISPV